MPQRTTIGLEMMVNEIGQPGLIIHCPHCGKTGDVVYERDEALRLLAETEAAIRKASPGKPS